MASHSSSPQFEPGARGMSTGAAVVGMLIAGVGGFLLRGVVDLGQGGAAAGGLDAEIAVVPQGAVDPSVERFKVPLGNGPVRGPATAKVTIIEFSDYQCPFCSRAEQTLNQVERAYGKDVRILFKNNPLPFHPNAMPAAEAALAAHEQGKFWAMHAKLFANQRELSAENYEKWAGELGLDLGKFKAAMAAHKLKAQIDAEQQESNRFGARGTPAFFINGRFFSGAQPFEAFKAIIDQEITAANQAIKAGVKPEQVYAALTKNGKTGEDAPTAPTAPTVQPKPRLQPPADTTVYKALVGDAPTRGPKDAKVTIVEFSDYQCPFCSRVEPTIDQVLKEFPNDVRVAFKQLPLPFHANAHLAAEASLAAKEQGKFWEMHALLFKNQQALERPALEKYAAELGLNLAKFKTALDSGKFKQKVDTEMAEGNKIGARGTPSFFVNGKTFVGAQPFEAFKSKVEEELKNANALIEQKKIPASKVYEELMKGAKESVGGAEAPSGGGDAPPAEVIQVDPGPGPSKGAKNAPVTIVEFSDFQCPFCSRVEPTVKQIEEKYAGKVRIVWRNFPLPFHQNAMPAHEAAMAAHQQGKFWQMHGKIFGSPSELDAATFEKYAQELGLDVGKYKADIASGRMKQLIQADLDYGSKLPGGGMGTPSFFINGRKLAGAYPFEEFAKVIDEELKKKGAK